MNRVWPSVIPAWRSSSAAAIVATSVVLLVQAGTDSQAFSVPTGDWHGIDGTWSTVSWTIGYPPQSVNMLVSLSLSEIWAIGPGACFPGESRCVYARGGLYEPDESGGWLAVNGQSMGPDYLRNEGHGIYGTDMLTTTSNFDSRYIRIDSTVIATLNTTNHNLGYFGLGISMSATNYTLTQPPLMGVASDFGEIPSYSYGYTAGAWYRNMPASLTLGGYDLQRTAEPSVRFKLGGDNLPRALVRSITLDLFNKTLKPPTHWKSSQYPVSTWNGSFEVIIDSTTPFLWLPDGVCDEIAEAFDLSYNSTFDLYTLTSDQYRELSVEDTYLVSFSLLSVDNVNDLGQPLRTAGVVEITLPLRAFVSSLQYPFMNGSIAYDEPAVPYFALRKAHNSSHFVLGRSFLQEAYIITDYDSRIFSVQQALFPSTLDMDIVTIIHARDTPYSDEEIGGLSKQQIGGIAAGSLAAASIILTLYMLKMRRRRNRRKAEKELALTMNYEWKHPKTSTDVPKYVEKDRVRSMLRRLRAKIRMRKISNGTKDVSEALSNDIYELPVANVPAELDTTENYELLALNEADPGWLNGAQQLSDDEESRLGVTQTIESPLPEYAPPRHGQLPPPEKALYDTASRDELRTELPISDTQQQPGHCTSDRRLSFRSVVISPVSYNSSSPRASMLSPASVEPDWKERAVNAPAPAAALLQASKPASPLRSQSPTNSGVDRGHDTKYPSTTAPVQYSSNEAREVLHRRPLIDSSNVVCLGPLPENFQLLRRKPVAQITRPVDQATHMHEKLAPDRISFVESLGSDFTDEEEERLDVMAAAHTSDQAQHRRLNPFATPKVGVLQRQRSNSSSDGTSNVNKWRTHTPRAGLSRERSRICTDTEPVRLPQLTRTENFESNEERIGTGSELVHVPQVPDRRYSWD